MATGVGVAVGVSAALPLSISDSLQAVRVSEKASAINILLSILETPRNRFLPRLRMRVQLSMENGVRKRNVTDEFRKYSVWVITLRGLSVGRIRAPLINSVVN